jgi:hypothetical protein
MGFDLRMNTVAHAFKQRAYTSSLIGKWHCGHAKDAYLPHRRGFDSWFGMKGAAFNHRTKISQMCDGLPDLYQGTAANPVTTAVSEPRLLADNYHATDLFANKAIKEILAHDQQVPLFQVLSFTAPHDPLLVDKSPEGQALLTHGPCAAHPTSRRKQFCVMLSQVDQAVQRVVKALEVRGWWERHTCLMVLSDNGGMPLAGGSNTPLRGTKSGAFEGGVRVPAFLKLPGLLMSQQQRHHTNGDVTGYSYDLPFHITDVAPTLLGVSDALALPRSKVLDAPQIKFDGQDMLPCLKMTVAGMNEKESTEVAKISLADRCKAEVATRSIILQHDPYVNGTAFLSWPWKLVLGSPGVPWVYEEPTSDWFMNTDGSDETYSPANFLLRTTAIEGIGETLDKWQDGWAETLIVPSYVAAMQRSALSDWFHGIHFRNFYLDEHRDLDEISIWTNESCPQLEWWGIGLDAPPLAMGISRNTTRQPRYPGGQLIFLFNVEEDPSESFNLAAERPRQVEEMHAELCSLLAESSGQLIAGDAQDSEKDTVGCEAWLADNVDVVQLGSVKARYFIEASRKVRGLVQLGGLVGSLLLVVAILVLKRAISSRPGAATMAESSSNHQKRKKS